LLGCTVEELKHRIGDKEFQEWIDYHDLEPWSISQGDRRTVVLGWLICSMLGSKEASMESLAKLLPNAFSGGRPSTEDERENAKNPDNVRAMWSVLRQTFGGKPGG
jgi:hypothetical protein